MTLEQIVWGSVTITDIAIGFGVLFFGVIVAKIISLYFKRIFRDKVSKDHQQLIGKVLYYTIILLALLVALPLLGVKASGLMVAGGVVGIAIGFASQSIISNLLSGLFIIIERPIKIGNAVNIDGTIGVVDDIRVMSIMLRTFDGLFVRVPNQKVFTANIINYVTNVARRFEYVVGIRYSDNADQAVEIIKTLIDEQPLALKKPDPVVYVSGLGDSSVNISIRLWAPASEWFDLNMMLLSKIKLAIEAAGMEIPFPQRVVWQGVSETTPLPETTK